MAENNKKNNKKETSNKASGSNKKVVTNKKQNSNKKVTEDKKASKVAISKEEPIIEKKEIAPQAEKKITNKNKKFKLSDSQRDLALVALVVVVLIVALFVTSSKVEKVNIDLPVTLTDDYGYTEITYSQYEEKLKQEKPFLLVIVRDGCGYCEQYEPIVREVVEENKVPVYYINLSNINEDEFNNLSKSNSYLKKNNWGTPTTLLLQGKTVIDSIGGYVEKNTLKVFIEENIKVENNAE